MNSSSIPYKQSPPKALWVQQFQNRPLGVVSIAIIVCLIAASALAPLYNFVFNISPDQVDLLNRFAGPSLSNPLGTDELGRDVLSRLLHGGQISLFIGMVAAGFAAILGTVLGLTAGYFGGRLDAVLMRFTDIVIALPLLPVLIVLAAIDLGELGLSNTFASHEYISLVRIITIVVLFGWTTTARLVRASTLSLREQPFVLAAEAQGATPARIMAVHILPNLTSPIIVSTTLAIGNIILLESALSFLGLGIQPPTPSWGNLLTNAQELIWEAPALAFYPGFLIFLTVISFNFLGDSLREALDPRKNKAVE